MSSNMYEYNADCRQPDPEIWGGGVAGGPLTFNSGLDYSEKVSYRYSLDTLPGSSSTGQLIISSSLTESSTKDYFGSAIIFYISGEKLEPTTFNPPESTCQIQISGSSLSSLIQQEVTSSVELESSGICVEKVTYDYNLDSTVDFSSEDVGLIGSLTSQFDNYGNILDVIDEGQENYGSTEISQTTSSSIGVISLSGYAIPIQNISEVSIGNINVHSSSIEKVTYNPQESSLQIQLSGSSLSEFVSYNPPESIVSVETSGVCIEKISYDYNDSSNIIFSSEIDGLISDPTTESLDYGLVSSTPTSNEDFNLILFASNVSSFGSATFSGSAFVKPPDDIRTYIAGATYKVTYNPPENVFSLFTFGEKVESVSYDYNIDSVKVVSTESLGLLTDSITLVDDGGLITESILDFVDYEGVDITSTTYPFGTLTLNGSASTEWINKNFSASGEYKVVYSPDNTSGTLFSFGETTESVVYDYTIDSVKVVSTESLGLLTDSITLVDDGGLITDISTEFFDYEGIDVTTTNNPFGTLTLNGSANTEWINKNFSASGEYKVVYSPDNTSGTLFSFGENIESVTYDYNESSILLVGDPNYGLISVGSTVSDDYGLVSEVHAQTEDYETILGFSASGDIYPFGSVIISGFVTESTSYSSPQNEILIDLSGSIEESVTFIPPINANSYEYLTFDSTSITFDSIGVEFEPGEIRNIKLTGSIQGNPTTYSEIGSGSLFNIGSTEKSVTYDYNQSSVVSLNVEDSGSIGSPTTSSVDYGLVSELYIGEDENGLIADISTLTPFGGCLISGSAITEWVNVNIYNSPEALVRVTYSPDDTTGTLFSFGEKLESATYDYNEESILPYIIDDSGSITSPVTEIDDYGLIAEVYGETDDYGSENGIIIGFGSTETIYPFGSIIVSGSSGNVLRTYDEENTILFQFYGELNPPNIDYTPSISGIGNISINGSADSSFVTDDVSTPTPITLSEIAVERRTHSYNESSTFFDIAPSFGLISSPLSESSDDYGSISILGGETQEYGEVSLGIQTSLPYGTLTISGTTLVYPDVDYTPSPDGSGTISVSGSATYSETDTFGVDRRRGGNINLCGDALYSETDVYIGLGTIFLDQQAETVSALLARTRSYVGIETIILSDTGLESRTIFIPTSGIGTGFIGGTINILGNAIESFGANTPENTQLFTFSGELTHPQIDYTPHYGIEKNIGIGTTGIQISGIADKSEIDSYVSSGSINIVNGFSPQDTEAYPGGPSVGKSWSYTRTTYIAEPVSLNISSGIAQTHYYSPIYPRNALITDPSSGIGTIRINDDRQLTFYRATLPIFAKGKIYILGIGTAGNGDLDGVEIGATERFTPATEVGTGLFTISGISSNREINVYQGYQTEGLITISQETTPIIEKYTSSYLGIGTIFVSETLIERNTESYVGFGTILSLSGDSESYSAQTPEETIILTVSGSAQESFIAQTPENTIPYQFSGASTDEKLIKSYVGSGSIEISSSAVVTSSPAYPASGIVRFANTHHVDNLYDTCDSVDITSDEQSSAYVSFTANPQETTVLFDIDGNAITSETALYTEFVVGLYTLSGTYQSVKLIHSESAIGAIFITETSFESERDVYIGSGNLFGLSGATEYYSAQTPESTIILQISGSALTSIESEYSTVGIGLFVFGGTAITSNIASYTKVGSGNISLSGQLVYPDITFIPSPDGSGTINILGSSHESITKLYDDTSGTLFHFSSGFESFTKSTYIGIGTVYIQELNASTINNPFQIPRTYVCII